MKFGIFLLVFLGLYSCDFLLENDEKINNSLPPIILGGSNYSKKVTGQFIITDFDSINNWRIIYTKDDYKFFKIVFNEKLIKTDEKNIIGKTYKLNFQQIETINTDTSKTKIRNDCYLFDRNTNICTEKENLIFSLYKGESFGVE